MNIASVLYVVFLGLLLLLLLLILLLSLRASFWALSDLGSAGG
jgi:hypothetical protein